jgi:hypothetical protein
MQETIFVVIGESLCGGLPGGVVGIGIIHAEMRTRQKEFLEKVLESCPCCPVVVGR